MLRATISVSTTDEGVEIIHKLGLTDVTKIVANQKTSGGGGAVDITIYTSHNEEITICTAFSMGYRGRGPAGLFQILMEFGVSCEEARFVYESVEKGEHVFKPRF